MDKDLNGTHSCVKIFKRKDWVTVRCCIRKNQEEDGFDKPRGHETQRPRGERLLVEGGGPCPSQKKTSIQKH